MQWEGDNEQGKGHILKVNEFQIAMAVVDVFRAIGLEGGVQPVVDQGGGYVKAFVTFELGAEAEVHVLLGDEEVLVEKAYIFQHRASVDGGPGTSSEYIFWVLIFLPSGKIRMPYFSSASRYRVNIAGAIQEMWPVLKDHFGGAEAHFQMPVQGFDEFLQPVGIDLGIVVKQGDVLAVCLPYAYVISLTEAEVFAEAYDSNFWELAFHELCRPVNRTVVH